MAYMSQKRKALIAPYVKKLLKRYGVKGTLAVDNHSTLVLNIKSGEIDFIQNFNETVAKRPEGFGLGSPARDYIDVNPYWYQDHFSGVAKKFLTEVLREMNHGNHDNSNSQIDYFDVGWYVRVNIGKWNKPYALEK